MDISVLISRILLLFIMIIPGFVLRKIDMLDGKQSKGLTNLVLYVAQPALIFVSFLRPFDKAILGKMLAVFIFGFLVTTAGCFGSLLLFRKVPEKRRSVLRYSVAFENALFIGLPLVTGIFGSEAGIYASVFALCENIYCWSLGSYLYTYDRSYMSVKKMFLNPSVLAAAAGILFFILDLHDNIPNLFTGSLDMLGALVSPLSMIVIGIRLAEVNAREVFNDKYMYASAFFRLIAGPLISFVLLKAGELIFGYHNDMVTYMTIILYATPAASTTSMFAEKFDGDAPYASKCVSFSTLLSLLTMPLVALLTKI